MSKTKVKLSIDKGATFRFPFRWSDAAGNSYIPDATFQCHFRETVESDTVLINLTSANGGFQVGSLDGQPVAYMHIDHLETSAIPVNFAVFDVEGTLSNGERVRLFSGTASFSDEVTR